MVLCLFIQRFLLNRIKHNLKNIIKMKGKSFILAIVSVFLMTSCATIFTGTKDTLRFDSNPQGARVYVDGLEVGKTPCTTSVKRSLTEKFAEIRLEGYETRVITLDRTFNVVSVINLGSFLGWAIDAATGALIKYDRKGYFVDLEKDDENLLLKNSSKIEINTDTKIVNVYVPQE